MNSYGVEVNQMYGEGRMSAAGDARGVGAGVAAGGVSEGGSAGLSGGLGVQAQAGGVSGMQMRGGASAVGAAGVGIGAGAVASAQPGQTGSMHPVQMGQMAQVRGGGGMYTVQSNMGSAGYVAGVQAGGAGAGAGMQQGAGMNQRAANQIFAQQYEAWQNDEVAKAVRAASDAYDAFGNLDQVHRQQAIFACMNMVAGKPQ